MGQPPRPVYLYIDDDEVALRDARHLWGKGTWETDEAKMRYIASVCVAAGGVRQEDVETKADTIGALLDEIRGSRPGVYAVMLDPSGTRIDRRRGILALVPGGITRPAALDHPLCDGIEVTLS